jgi:hypothetical protein
VVSDLSEFHGLDLVQVVRDGSMSPRMLLARLACLPDTSALHASLRGEPRGWGMDRHLSATVVDAIQENSWLTAAVASKRKPRKPRPIPRPKSTAKPQGRVVSVAALNQKAGGDDGRTGR